MNTTDNPPPLMRTPFLIFGTLLLISSSAIAQTNCSDVQKEKGSAAYLECQRKEDIQQIKDGITKFKEQISMEKDDLKKRYDRWISDAEDVRDDLDRDLKRREEDLSDMIADLKDTDASADRIAAEKVRLDAFKSERKAAKSAYDKRIKLLKDQRDMEITRLDLQLAQYEWDVWKRRSW
ncbi:MAG: hypothetical protein WCX61_04450 [Candidatus Peribacteraceae bacterium]|jgi:hypothetical protein